MTSDLHMCQQLCVYSRYTMQTLSVVLTAWCDPQDVKHRIQQDFIPTFLAECLYWPFIQGVNFWKVPVKHQLLVVNTACLADSTFLSW